MNGSFGFIYVENTGDRAKTAHSSYCPHNVSFFSGRYLSSLKGQANLPSLLIMALAFCTWTYVFVLARSWPFFSFIEWPMSSRKLASLPFLVVIPYNKHFAIWSLIPRRNAYCLSVYITPYTISKCYHSHNIQLVT